MDWLYQLGISLLSVGAMYGAIRADLNNMKRSLDEERRLREHLGDTVREAFIDLREKLGEVSNRVARNEGASDATSRLAEALSDALSKK